MKDVLLNSFFIEEFERKEKAENTQEAVHPMDISKTKTIKISGLSTKKRQSLSEEYFI